MAHAFLQAGCLSSYQINSVKAMTPASKKPPIGLILS